MHTVREIQCLSPDCFFLVANVGVIPAHFHHFKMVPLNVAVAADISLGLEVSQDTDYFLTIQEGSQFILFTEQPS